MNRPDHFSDIGKPPGKKECVRNANQAANDKRGHYTNLRVEAPGQKAADWSRAHHGHRKQAHNPFPFAVVDNRLQDSVARLHLYDHPEPGQEHQAGQPDKPRKRECDNTDP